jgi:hypothetical protein
LRLLGRGEGGDVGAGLGPALVEREGGGGWLVLRVGVMVERVTVDEFVVDALEFKE